MPRLPEERTVGAQVTTPSRTKPLQTQQSSSAARPVRLMSFPSGIGAGGAEIAFASAPETGSRRRAAKTKTPAAVIIKAGIRKEYRQFRMAASVPDIAHAMKCPKIMVMDRTNEARSRA